MTPEVQAIAKSQDIIQMLFYCVCAMGTGITLSLAWFGRYILVPMRDRHFDYLDKQDAFMRAIVDGSSARNEMHQQNSKRLSDLFGITKEVRDRLMRLDCNSKE